MRRPVLAAITAVLLAFSGAFAVVAANPASAAPTGCHSVFHYTASDGASNSYNIYKYECDGNQTYGYMTGNPGPACITISLGNVADGPCWSIPTGYTPPRTSIQTKTLSAGSSVKLTGICFNNYYGATLWCHNDYG